ncbi:hypothetical protein KHA94_01590 [Bacillus sp. FJAT-49705]|uniref:Uncharacterized protein n=1 Tax=Cytobacillus citreus TaxID=2833586 RepID=A0ABS5NM79_9BACI|nr:hypothetical protein [Cytobacillus citreus]MBS4188912.1 hypothetical protein [Cytobacillus citreus]
MGIIAPVTLYEYNQYAERDISKRYDPYRFVPIRPIKSTTNPPEYEQKNRPHFSTVPKKLLRGNQHSHLENSEIERVFGEITGKGRYFNTFA